METLNKICIKCRKELPISCFVHDKNKKDGTRNTCRKCRNKMHKRWYRKNRQKAALYGNVWYHKNKRSILPQLLFYRARNRARLAGLPFRISRKDIIIPEICPALGVRLEMNSITPGPNSPSLDRIVPRLGYVPGNVQVISLKANLIHSNGSPEELRLVAKWLEGELANVPSRDFNT
jgi:hypothetical protein